MLKAEFKKLLDDEEYWGDETDYLEDNEEEQNEEEQSDEEIE